MWNISHHCSLKFVPWFLFLKVAHISYFNKQMKILLSVFPHYSRTIKHEIFSFFLKYAHFNLVLIDSIWLKSFDCFWEELLKIDFLGNTFYFFNFIFFSLTATTYQNFCLMNWIEILLSYSVHKWYISLSWFLNDDSFWKLRQYSFKLLWNLNFSIVC